jgi:hypothetical protein
MDKIFQAKLWDEMDLTIELYFYLDFLSFNVACFPLFTKMCQPLIERAPIGYLLPSLENLRTTLLVKEKKEVVKLLTLTKSKWPSFGVSIVYDGWTDTTRQPLINSMVLLKNGPIFLKAVNALGKYQDANYMGDLLISVIE